MTGRNLRAALLASAVAALASLASVPGEGTVSAGGSLLVIREAAAESNELRVGDRLVAITDVELDEAIVKAGSSVSVVGRKKRAGNVVIDVALADGHVVKSVPQVRLRNAFRLS